MSDFTIRVKNLPFDSEYGNNENILKAYLWEHFNGLLVKESKSYKLKNNNSL